MKIIHTISEMQSTSEILRQQGKRIAFVPTMGFLHEGHLSLMRKGRENADTLVASIFVNPAQFGANEDLDSYPQAFESDLEKCRAQGVNIIFAPTRDAIYPKGYETYIELEKLPPHPCGISRPVFFKGIATVVTKLFHIVKPHVAVFGEKDFQQLAIIRRMVTDLNMEVEILGGPLVREKDGLAMSSRNAYLTPAQRKEGVRLYQSLCAAEKSVQNGETDPESLRAAAKEHIEKAGDAAIDYISICDPATLEEVEKIAGPVLMAMAVIMGKTRLIDNRVLRP